TRTAAARRTTPRAAIRSPRGASRRSVTGPARRASSPTVTSSAAVVAARRRAAADGAFDEKGPVGRRAADVADQRDERGGQKTDDQNLVARLDDLPGDGRPHDRRPRRQKTRAGLHLGVDGRAQARRVRPDPHLPFARRPQLGTWTD